MTQTVYVSIGNSDSKLTQEEWALYWDQVNDVILSWNDGILGVWLSLPNDMYQNACWAILIEDRDFAEIKPALKELAKLWGQDSIAWAVAETEFIKGV